MENKNLNWYQKPFITADNSIRWWSIGLCFGIVSYIVMMIVLAVNSRLSPTIFLIGIPLCAIGGLIFGAMLKRNFNMQLSSRRKR